MSSKIDWAPAVDTALASRVTDCGHQIRRNEPVLWVRTERAGSRYEVWVVCTSCHTDDDYRYRLDIADPPPPQRVRIETLEPRKPVS